VNVQNAVPFNVIGDATSSAINFGFTSADAGTYTVVLSDMTRRVVTTKTIVATPGEQSFSVNGLGIAPGMYVAKITNGAVSGVTKVSVQ
ncbi:MAG: T9SS type A sorting domain-containing protein, partial [Taibaiella sp.]|nr:T9SS type A sorting domain-containing protein [Taibaiella sp.]